MKDPKLMAGLKELAKAGATRISLGQKLEEKLAFSEIEGQLRFRGTKWKKELDKYLESMRTVLFMASPEGGRGAKEARSKGAVDWIEKEITSGSKPGKIIASRIENGMAIWTVQWPSGDKEEIKYPIK